MKSLLDEMVSSPSISPELSVCHFEPKVQKTVGAGEPRKLLLGWLVTPLSSRSPRPTKTCWQERSTWSTQEECKKGHNVLGSQKVQNLSPHVSEWESV